MSKPDFLATNLAESASEQLFERACRVIPGGVNSPVRSCASVGCPPLFIASGEGSRLTTAGGQEFIDYVESWGPLLLGHNHPVVNAALHKAVDKGVSFGAPCEGEVLLAEAITQAMPHLEMVRMVNSGTEATMSAVRLARGVTKRNKIIKFKGCYHGHGDVFLAAAGSGVATLSIPGTRGVPEAVVADTLLAEYNDLPAVEALFKAHPGQIAALIVEPCAGNMGLVPPQPGFLEGLRDLCTAHSALLIFDAVITGFRLAYGGATKRYGVTPDLVTLGKIIGGGLPVGAYGGKKEFMQHISPLGGVYQAGTLSGNPLAMAAGLATLQTLKACDYSRLEKRVADFCLELQDILSAKKVPLTINQTASMFTLFFSSGPVRNFQEASQANSQMYSAFYAQMRAQGIYLAPSAFECAMVSFAHTDEDLKKTLRAAEQVQL